MDEELFFDLPDENPDDEDKAKDEVDPALVARLDQEEAAFAEDAARWYQIYGFHHDCTCGQDYASGNVTQVTVCFMRLTQQALRRCAESNMEIRALGSMLEHMVKINNDLVTMLEEAGLQKELQDYFGTELDEPQVTDLEDLDSEFEQLLLDAAEETDNGDEDTGFVPA